MIRIILLTLFSLISFSVTAEDSETKHAYKISEIIAGIPDSFYSTEGYVVLVLECPPPELKVFCLVADHIVVSENLERFDESAQKKYLYLYPNPAQKFEVNKKYMFLIRAGNISDKTLPEITDFHEIPE